MTTQTDNNLLANSANNHLYANELFLLAELFNLGVDSIGTAPPGSPADFNSRLIAGTGTGDFTGHDNKLALYYDASWIYAAPVDGMRIWVKSLQCYYRYASSSWQPDLAWYTLTDAASIAVNAGVARNFQVTLGGNRTLANPTNITGTGLNNDGKTFLFRVVQDGTGSRTLAYGSKYKFAGGSAPTLSTGAGDIDLLEFIYHAADDILMFKGSWLNIS